MMSDESHNGSNTTVEEKWRGCSMAEIHRNLNEFELEHVTSVRPTADHTVLYHCPIRVDDNVPPRPLKAHPKWDALHVRLPCSSKSQYPVTAEDGSSTIESRWEMVIQALSQPIKNSHELQDAILAYNSKYKGKWKFSALHSLFEQELDDSEAHVFFEDLLPRIIRLALRLPELIQAPIPLLKQGQNHSITLSQQQISCLLANAFLCTFPRRNTSNRKSEYSSFPDINFNRLFSSSSYSVLEKIKCICHYFRRVCPTEVDSSNVPIGVVTFTRRSLNPRDMPAWGECSVPLGITPLHVTSEGNIEDQFGLLQVDFANKFLGGGVLGCGCVQEEIRFVICPELIISKLFTECLRPNEALLMVGCERFSSYTGYAGTFHWAGNYEDATPRDSSRRILTHVIAIDALAFVQTEHQYRDELMLRELNKAYVGFLHNLVTPAPGIASGNWGCGAFGGEPSLKALLQIMACAVAKRPLVYLTFGNVELRDKIHQMHTFFIEQNIRVKDLWRTLKKFRKHQLPSNELYIFIYKCHREKTKSSLNSLRSSPRNKVQSDAVGSSKSPPATHPSADDNASAVGSHKISQTFNMSEDIFASSSSEAENDIDSPSVSNAQASMTRIAISDDSETDAVLLAAVDEVNIHTETTLTSSYASQTPRKKTNSGALRQRTLLEMLDKCYTEDDKPDLKRHRSNSTIQKS